MSSNESATFIGHNECYGLNRGAVRSEIVKLIEAGVTEFYSGGMGNFNPFD